MIAGAFQQGCDERKRWRARADVVGGESCVRRRPLRMLLGAQGWRGKRGGCSQRQRRNAPASWVSGVLLLRLPPREASRASVFGKVTASK